MRGLSLPRRHGHDCCAVSRRHVPAGKADTVGRHDRHLLIWTTEVERIDVGAWSVRRADRHRERQHDPERAEDACRGRAAQIGASGVRIAFVIATTASPQARGAPSPPAPAGTMLSPRPARRQRGRRDAQGCALERKQSERPGDRRARAGPEAWVKHDGRADDSQCDPAPKPMVAPDSSPVRARRKRRLPRGRRQLMAATKSVMLRVVSCLSADLRIRRT